MSIKRRELRAERQIDGALLLPGAAGSVGLGLLAAQWPLVGAGLGAAMILSSLPWVALFVVLAFSAVFNKAALSVGGLTFRLEELILVPFAIRAYLLTRPAARLRWRWPEWVLVLWLGLNAATSYLHSSRVSRSFIILTLLCFGAVAYISVFSATCTKRRLIQAARVILWIALFGAATGLLALLSHYLLGTSFGVNTTKQSGIPTVHGLAYENNIYGSGSAFGAVAFLVLIRNENPLFSRRFCIVAFWLCFIALMASLTRGAWIGFGAAVVAMAILRRRRRSRPIRPERTAVAVILSALLVVGLVWVATAPEGGFGTGPFAVVRDKGQQLLDFTQGTGRARAAEWRVALNEVLEEQPLLGLGTNSFSQRHSLQQKTAYLGNLYVRTLYDTGIVGLALFMLFLLSVLWPTRELLRSKDELAIVARCLMFGWGALAVAFAGTDSMFLMWPWILLGVTRAARGQALQQARELRRTAPGGPSGNGHLPDAQADGRSDALGRAPASPLISPA